MFRLKEKATKTKEEQPLIVKETNEPDYRIFTKEDYRRHFFNVYLKAPNIDRESIKHMERTWDRTRKGYNFVIAVGKGDNLHFFSVKGFEEMVLGVKE
ncbi:hypothetical protein [uncultured Clostridium sp.]|uniref:hypothetical protein n=1 Tax=uncultured Clostridium sp. TaxID=59620 RepID=UPI0028E8B92A|nr:hypothetical protein [uncultured Clostridium sp.]